MKEFDRLIAIFDKLRGPDGCPWDAEQDHKSISRCMIEEAYELIDAITSEDPEHLREELGDVLLQVVFHSAIAKDDDNFTIGDVINDLCDKLIRRHPHVFGTTIVKNSREVARNWNYLKKKEGGKQLRDSILDGIPDTLPSLLYARKIQSLVGKVGFDFQKSNGIIEKIKEKIGKCNQSIKTKDRDEIEDDIGELLFSIVGLARSLDIDPEATLRMTSHKFKQGFYEIEIEAKKRGMPLEKMIFKDMNQGGEKEKQ